MLLLSLVDIYSLVVTHCSYFVEIYIKLDSFLYNIPCPCGHLYLIVAEISVTEFILVYPVCFQKV
jgi:hypothetical protein